jgi:hypothetical protein
LKNWLWPAVWIARARPPLSPRRQISIDESLQSPVPRDRIVLGREGVITLKNSNEIEGTLKIKLA